MSLHLHLEVHQGDYQLHADSDLPEKGVTAVFGPSGCGKTTLLRILAGLDRHPGCRVRNQDTVWQDDEVWVPPHRRDIGLVFQKAALFPHLSVAGNLHYALKRSPKVHRTLSMEEIIEYLEISTLLKRHPDTLSGGEAQRVAIARTLASNPRVLLMDEPLSALDDGACSRILGYLEQLRERLEIPVVYVSHSLEEVARLADTLLLMERGSLRSQGPAEELLSDPEKGLARMESAQTFVKGVVHSTSNDVTVIRNEDGDWILPGSGIQEGTNTRIRVQARDVSISLRTPEDCSFQNLIPATVTDRHDLERGQTLIRLQIRSGVLLSRLTIRSAETLQLVPGKSVVAQIKTASFS